MQYRRATQADVAELAAMNAELIRDEGHRNRMALAELEGRMAGWLEGEYRAVVILCGRRDDGPGGSRLRLAEADETAEFAGYALFRQEPDYVYLRQFFVRAVYRRCGVGRAALQWLSANAWGGQRVRVEVLVGNAAGIAFWRAVGFADYCLTLERPDDAAS